MSSSPSAMLVLATATILSGAAAHASVGLPPSPGDSETTASGDGGNPVAVGDSWMVRFEYDLAETSSCFVPVPNFVEATPGCYGEDSPITACSIETGRAGNSSENVELAYLSAECSTDVTSVISKRFGDAGPYLRLDYYLDDDCATLAYTNAYSPDGGKCHVGARQDARGDWLGVSTKVTLDVGMTDASARVLQFNTTDCSGDPTIDLAISKETLLSNACVGRVKASTSFPFSDASGEGNGASTVRSIGLAGIAAVATAFTMAVYA